MVSGFNNPNLTQQEQSMSYVPPGQPQVLTDNASTQTVVQAGAGATQVVMHQKDGIQSTAEGDIQGTQTGMGATSTYDVTHTTVESPLLPAGTVPENDTGLGALFESFVLPTATSSQGNAEDVDDDALFSLFSLSSSSTSETASTQGTVDGSTVSDSLSDTELGQVSDLYSPYTTADRVYASLVSMLNLDEGVEPSDELKATLTLIATSIADGAKEGGLAGIDSQDQESIKGVLIALYGGSDTQIEESLGTIASAIAATNAQLHADLGSGNIPVTKKVIYALADLDNSSLTAEEKAVVSNYLDVMLTMLVFMAQLRQFITDLEGKYAQVQNSAKLQQTKEQSQLAMDQFSVSVKSVETNLKKTLENIHKQKEAEKHAKLMKWLGPTITAAGALTAVIIVVATMGLAAPVAIALCVGILGMAALQAADQATTDPSKGQEGILTKWAKSCGCKSDSEIAAFKMAIMLAPLLVCLPVAGVAAGASAMSGAALFAAGSLVAESVFTSGLMTNGIYTIAKKCGQSDDEAMMTAMITTLVLMVLMMGLMLKFAPKPEAAKTIGETAGATAKGAETGVELVDAGGDVASTSSSATKAGTNVDDVAETGEDMANRTDDIDNAGKAGDGKKGAPSAADDTSVTLEETASQQASATTAQLKRLLDGMKRALGDIFDKIPEAMKNPTNYIAIMNIISSIMQAKASFAMKDAEEMQADLSEVQADYQASLSQFSGVLDFLRTIGSGFDEQAKAITNTNDGDIKAIMDFVEGLMQLFEQTIQQASKNVVQSSLAAQGRG